MSLLCGVVPPIAMLPACGGEDDAATDLCGNGRVDPGEDCDGERTDAWRCTHLLPSAGGALTCTEDCRWDTSLCYRCGDGIRDWGEECDCGTEAPGDPLLFPAGCNAPNGDPASSCAADCTRHPRCGNGIVDLNEACDDGNVWTGDGCTSECRVGCRPALMQTCDASAVGGPEPCCDDPWGQETTCAASEAWTAVCLHRCDDTSDCHRSSECHQQAPGFCAPAFCGDTGTGEGINAFCTVAGGGEGWCWPEELRPRSGVPSHSFWNLPHGVCRESGLLEPGAACETHPGTGGPRHRPACHLGHCVAEVGERTGRCEQFCDPHAELDRLLRERPNHGSLLPCPTGTGCVAEVVFLEDAPRLWRGTCRDASREVSCSLVTGQLLVDPTLTCEDRIPGGRCRFVAIDGQPDFPVAPAVVGTCQPGQEPQLGVWDPCDPDRPDDCPRGSLCKNTDAYESYCLPFCDLEQHNGIFGTCEDLGTPPWGLCLEHLASARYPPGRLGFCWPVGGVP